MIIVHTANNGIHVMHISVLGFNNGVLNVVVFNSKSVNSQIKLTTLIETLLKLL